jgi:hypothetical protein
MGEGIHIQTNRLVEGFRKYAFEMDSGAMIYIRSFIEIGSGIQKLTWDIHRQHNDFVSLRKNRLCGLVVRILGYKSGGPGSILGTARKKNK